MLRGLIRFAVSAAFTLAPTGCLWVTGAVTAVVLLTEEDDESPVQPEDPVPPPEVVLRGPFIALDGTPADVAVGEFIRRDGADSSPTDVAVLASDRLSVRFFRGDGFGRLFEDAVVPLSPEASIPAVGLVVIPDLASGGDGLLVATASSLEHLAFVASGGVPVLQQAIPLGFEQGRRDVEVGDFNGDGVPDAAVSSQENETVELFMGGLVDGALRFDSRAGSILEESDSGSTEASLRSPRAIAVANFDVDPHGFSDLAVLVVETQTPVVKLYLSRGDGNTFWLQDRFVSLDANVDFGAALDARDGATFGSTNPYPDLLLNRDTRVSKLLVTSVVDETGTETGPWLRNYPQASGPAVRSPVSPCVIQLPRDSEDLRGPWDVVVGDTASDTVAFAYSSEDGIGVDYRFRYTLPGEPQAVAVGDLDANGYDDVVAVSARPATLSVLLANSPAADIAEDAFFFPYGSRAGENPPVPPAEPMTYGVLDAAGAQPFLVVLDGDERGATVIYLDPSSWKEVDRERHPLPGVELPDTLNTPLVADLDGIPGDEIIVVSDSGRIYELRPASVQVPRLRLARLIDLTDPAEVPSVPCELSSANPCQGGPCPCIDFRLRTPTADFLDGDDVPDLVIPITVRDSPDDYVAVILNPFVAPNVTFYETGDDPRHVCPANIDGDGAIDLLVACEGGDPQRGNRIHVLRGDPDDAGRFLDDGLEEWSIPGLCHPPDCVPDELEFLATDNEVTGTESRARVIVAATQYTVEVYFNKSRPDAIEVVGPCTVYKGVDPEYFVLRDLCGDDGLPELILADEDAESILVLKNVNGFDQATCINPWEPGELVVDKVTNSRFTLAPAPAGRGLLLACLTADSEVVAYSGGDGVCGFDRRVAIPLAPLDRVGRRSGLAAAPYDGDLPGTVVASVVEDLDPQTSWPALDLLFVPRRTPLSALRGFGAFRPTQPTARFRLENRVAVRHVYLGALDDGDSVLDLLVSDHATGDTDWLRGPLGPLWAEQDPPPGFYLEPLWTLGKGDALVGLECLNLADAPGAVLYATESAATLLSAVQQRVLWHFGTSPDAIRGIAHGFVDRATSRLDRLFVAILTERETRVRAITSDRATVLAAGGTGMIGSHDLNGDGRDDVVVVDPTTGSLRAYLHDQPFRFRDAASFEYGGSQDPKDLAFGDLNGDGRADVCVGMEDGTVYAFLGDGRFRDDSRSAVTLSRTYAGPKLEALRLADLDGDGRDEVIASVGTPGLVILTDWSAAAE